MATTADLYRVRMALSLIRADEQQHLPRARMVQGVTARDVRRVHRSMELALVRDAGISGEVWDQETHEDKAKGPCGAIR